MTEKTLPDHDPMELAFEFIDQVVENPDRYPDSFVAIRRDADLIAKMLSRERIRILDYLEHYGPVPSLQFLAEVLDRDKGAVSRDVNDLEAMGLVTVAEKGRRKELNATRRPILIV